MEITIGSCRKVKVSENYVIKIPYTDELSVHNKSEVRVYNAYKDECPYLADIIKVEKDIIYMEKTETFRDTILKEIDSYLDNVDVYTQRLLNKLEDMTSELTLDDEYTMYDLGYEDLYLSVINMIEINKELNMGLSEVEITSPYNWGINKEGCWKLFDYSIVPHYYV